MARRMTVPEIFDALEATPKKLEKLAILKAQQNNELLKIVFKYALDPYKQFGIKKIPDYTPLKMVGFTLKSVIKRLDLLVDRTYTGNAASEFLAKLLADVPEDEAEILKRIIAKDMRCGVQAKTVNKVWPDLIPEYPCLLCSTYNDKNMEAIVYPAYAQSKEDGMRINFIVSKGKVESRSRSGKEVDLLGFLDSSMIEMAGGQDIVFDGELLVSDGKGGYLPRKTGNGIVNKAIKGTIEADEAELIRVILWDAVTLKDFKLGKWDYPYEKRWSWLNKAFGRTTSDKVKLVESIEVDSFFFAKRMFEKITARGGEGIIIKNKDSIWESKRSKGQVKMKVENDADLIITDIIEGTGKYEGMLGSFFVSTADGLLTISVGSGFSDEQREEYFSKNMIGKIVELKYNEVIKSEKGETSLFLPIFRQIREDKTEANKLEELK